MSAQGFDEFMNIVMDDAAEVYVKDAQPRRELGASNPSIANDLCPQLSFQDVSY